MAAAPLALLKTLVMDGPPVAVWPNRAAPMISGSRPHKQAGFMQNLRYEPILRQIS
jgi:hypothetical protein